MSKKLKTFLDSSHQQSETSAIWLFKIQFAFVQPALSDGTFDNLGFAQVHSLEEVSCQRTRR